MTVLMVFLLLLGPVMGSFLMVLVDRLPRGENVLTKPSACRSCQTSLRPLDMVPLLSFLRLSGRCQYCAAVIPKTLFGMELGALAIAIMVVWGAKSDVQMVLAAGWLWVLLALALCDWHWMRLPNPLTAALFLLGLGLALEDPSRGVWDGLLAAGLGVLAFWAVRWGYFWWRGREGLGLGDVKVIAGIGAGLGLDFLPLTVLLAGIGGLVWALVQSRSQPHPVTGVTPLPFGAFLCVAAGGLYYGVAF